MRKRGSHEEANAMRSQARCGFTLVELLVVIVIIGILVGMMLPAVQIAREAARRAQCMNNLKQMALACNQHYTAQGFYPSGGWGWRWAGDPDRGFTKRQPGGWHYNILPYMDQVALHDLGKGGDLNGVKARLGTPVAIFICPTRRKVQSYPYTHGSPYINSAYPNPIGRSDYAGCGGDTLGSIQDGPGSLSGGDTYGWGPSNNGLIYQRSMVTNVPDGESFTYLIGERYLRPDSYYTGDLCANDQGWDLGYDYDVNRWTSIDPNNPPPMHDTPGYGGCDMNFGSAHDAGFHMAFCDGSVRRMNFSIERETHRRLGNRKDGLPVDVTQYIK
jgi:prepilin-type N-terminal cleavage/methylation domain-containing protein/prepilin-type processing-associated H-X9-DG protein